MPLPPSGRVVAAPRAVGLTAEDAAPVDGPGSAAAQTGGRASRPWDDVPLRTKVTLIVLLAVVGGSLAGMVESWMGHTVWPLSVGLTTLVVVIYVLGRWWIWSPFERLLSQLETLDVAGDAHQLQALPRQRHDEVGRLARAIHELTTSAIRGHREAKHLRRTIDHRVEQSIKQATSQLRQMAMRDPLTDLGNRRFMDEHLEPLVKSVRESGGDLLCVLIDVDHFKQVNDTQGHAHGDELLILLGSLIRAATRAEDYAVRLGGDEFALFMPSCPVARAKQVCEQLRTLFRQGHRPTRPNAAKTVVQADLSIGVSSLVRDGATTGRDLMDKADAYLYEAKRAGRGRTAGV